MKRLLLLLLLALPELAAWAQSGPQVPCVGCEQEGHFSEPTSGLWHNPERPGSGMTIQMQKGLLLGGLYTYGPDGVAQWYTFAGTLTPSETAPYTLTLSAPLVRYENGACADCEYRAPQPVEDGGTITLEFRQRNHASFAIGEGEPQFIVPLVLGLSVDPQIAASDYAWPDLTGNWAVTLEDTSGMWWTFYGGVYSPGTLQITETRIFHDLAGVVIGTRASIWDGDAGVGELQCDLIRDTAGVAQPECMLRLHTGYVPPLQDQGTYVDFPLPLANVGADRIEAVYPETGLRLKAFRIDFD